MNRSVIVPSRPFKVNRARSPERALTPLSGARKDGEEVEVLRSWLHGVVRVLQTAQLHLRLQEAVLLPVLPRVGQQVDLGARVVIPKSHKRAHERAPR